LPLRIKRPIYALFTLALLIAVGAASAQPNPADLTEIVETQRADTFSADNPAALAVQVSTDDASIQAVTGTRDGEQPALPDDRFRIASMSKTFVAVTALLMAEDGLLDLDDPAVDYLPEEVVTNIANLEGESGVTLRQLLAMQSGIDDYLGTEAFWAKVEDDPTFAWTTPEALTYGYGMEALFAPGEQVSYSNTNYLLIQLALEEAGDAPLHELVRDYILDPLAMTNTYTQAFEAAPRADDSILVNGYLDIEGDGIIDDVSGVNDGFGLGDGALVSTTADLTTFYRALLADRTLLSDESLAEMMTFAEDDFGGYGLGLAQWETDHGTAYGHSGGVVGFLSIGVYLPDADVTIMVLCATIECDVEALAEAALTLVLD
jgi:D-alanyl-D-alanine carboxypeptidase